MSLERTTFTLYGQPPRRGLARPASPCPRVPPEPAALTFLPVRLLDHQWLGRRAGMPETNTSAKMHHFTTSIQIRKNMGWKNHEKNGSLVSFPAIRSFLAHLLFEYLLLIDELHSLTKTRCTRQLWNATQCIHQVLVVEAVPVAVLLCLADDCFSSPHFFQLCRSLFSSTRSSDVSNVVPTLG